MEIKQTKILIGITGGIAVYKICSLVRDLCKKQHAVKVIMTENATKFVTPLTFESLSGNPVYLDTFKKQQYAIEHIELAKWADMMLVAPATANTIGKIAGGIADNLLLTTVLALKQPVPVLIAPAMNTRMWENFLIQKNIRFLQEINDGKKYIFIPPEEKLLACGDSGMGALADIRVIEETIEKELKHI